MITPRTSGIVGVHVWGQACDVESLEDLAAKHNLKLLFDAAHAFGSSHAGKKIGGFGDAEVFSFHATKFFNTFEGGAITTNNDELAIKVRLMHNFGFAGLDNVIYIGTNGKMSEVSAAMGLTGLEDLQTFVDVNYRNYLTYQRGLGDLDGLRLLAYDEEEQGNYQYIVLEMDEGLAGIGRNQLVQVLHAEHVRARRYFYPGCHQMEPYRSHFPHAGLLLPETERLVQRVLTLPNGTSVDEEKVSRICQLVRFVVSHGPEVSQALSIEDR
jgi:dTDP-4-amino-4,6-dideoxygalactose transaminase